MTTQRARKKEARALAQTEGIPYSEALRRLTAQQPEQDPGPRYIVQPTAEQAEAGIVAAELGVRALAADATPHQRATAEAHWRTNLNGVDGPCLCSGPCDHGEACTAEWEDDAGQTVRCPGQIVHVDRFPGSFFSITTWNDQYQCTNADECDVVYERSVALPELPYGEHRKEGERTTTVLWDDTRNPTLAIFDDEDQAGDGICRSCGGYAFEGLLCDGCRVELMRNDPDWDYYDDEEMYA